MDVLEVSIDGARYALPLARVLEVLPRVWLTPLPEAPLHVPGVFAYRGQTAVALDLRARWAHPPRPGRVTDHFVVTRGSRRPIAAIVDRVVGVRALSGDSVREPPLPSVLAGVVTLPDGVLLVDDLDALLSEADEAATERAVEAAAAGSAEVS